MPSDLDITRSAAVLIEHHGRDAVMEAARRADRRHFGSDDEGAAVWRSIMKAVEKLQAMEPEGGVQ